MISTLTFTIIVESLIVLGYSFSKKKPAISILLTSILGNLITQSLLWIGLNFFFQYYLRVLLIAEVLIWMTESVLLHLFRSNQLELKEAAFLSLLMNLSSIGLGWFLPV